MRSASGSASKKPDLSSISSGRNWKRRSKLSSQACRAAAAALVDRAQPPWSCKTMPARSSSARSRRARRRSSVTTATVAQPSSKASRTARSTQRASCSGPSASVSMKPGCSVFAASPPSTASRKRERASAGASISSGSRPSWVQKFSSAAPSRPLPRPCSQTCNGTCGGVSAKAARSAPARVSKPASHSVSSCRRLAKAARSEAA